MIVVKIHRQAYYVPKSLCASLQNDTLPIDASVQSCIWQCQHTYDCQTAVYDDGTRVCSMFSEVCTDGHIEPSTDERSNVICNRKSHRKFRLVFKDLDSCVL